MTTDECTSCGSRTKDREAYAARALATHNEVLPTGILDCPFCGAGKCIQCDMGDDVECVNCNADLRGEDGD